jgi:ribosome-interacting GTPase 1
MPANLTQQYLKAEQAWRRATTPQEELDCLQLMLKELPRHKGTDKLQADLKHRISRAREEVARPKKSGGGRGFRLPRQGAGRVVIIGGPNAGKSRLLAALTSAKPEIAPYPFTTREPLPGMMPWNDVMVQLIDTPPITADVYDPDVQSLIRGADLVLLMLDLGDDEGGRQLKDVWKHVNGTRTRLGNQTCIDENDVGVSFTRAFLVDNKLDLPEAADRKEFFSGYIDFELERFGISALTGEGIETLRDAIYQAMDVVRVYTKLPSKKEPDHDSPFTLPRGGTVQDLAELIHKDVARNFKSARVWGTGVHDGTPVKGDHLLHDGDIVELHM